MPNNKGKEKVVNTPNKSTDISEISLINEEKVEVLIKEIIRIRPQDFQAFKHALEDFVNSWDK